MRLIKNAAERKQEILDAAETLFYRKGFEATTTTDLLEMVGIARGTLYYHFKAKEDIMDALIERCSQRIFKKAEEIAGAQTLSVPEKILMIFQTMQAGGQDKALVMEHLHRPENIRMHQKLQAMIIREMTPLLAKVAKQGIRDGIFSTNEPYACMEMIMVYTSCAFDDDFLHKTEEEKAAKITGFIYNLERLLGAQKGSMDYVWKIFTHDE